MTKFTDEELFIRYAEITAVKALSDDKRVMFTDSQYAQNAADIADYMVRQHRKRFPLPADPAPPKAEVKNPCCPEKDPIDGEPCALGLGHSKRHERDDGLEWSRADTSSPMRLLGPWDGVMLRSGTSAWKSPTDTSEWFFACNCGRIRNGFKFNVEHAVCDYCGVRALRPQLTPVQKGNTRT